jgi:hypothetical protein
MIPMMNIYKSVRANVHASLAFFLPLFCIVGHDLATNLLQLHATMQNLFLDT